MKCSPFFIVGHERSGTTLMAALMDRHSSVAVPPETHFYTQLYPLVDQRPPVDRALMVDVFCAGPRTRDLKLDREQLLLRFGSVAPTWHNLFLEALKLYAESRGKAFAGEKTPTHWRVVPDLLARFPDSRVIWVVRDGRDTVLSLMKTPWKEHAYLPLHALQWRYTIERMLGYESEYPNRILRVRFENLVTRPQEEITRVCQFMGIDFESRQLDPSVETGVVPEWEFPWKGRVFGPPDPSRVGTAARELSPDSLQHLNLLIEPSMRRLGYDLTCDSRPRAHAA